jgi:hypothetical protein
MIWPHRQNYRAACDPLRQATLSMSMLSVFVAPSARHADAFEMTALVGVGILRPVGTAAPMRLTEPR